MAREADIAIIGGTGDLGFGLALRLALAEATTVIGSRRPHAAAEAADRVRSEVPAAQVTGYENTDAARSADLVALCVPFAAQSDNLTQLRDVLTEGQILIDTTVPLATALSGRPTRLLGLPQGSCAEQAQELVGSGVSVVSGLHSVSAANLENLDHTLDEDVLIAGDDSASKRRVGALLGRIAHLRPIDCGRLELARMLEALTPLLISVNRRYKTHAGVKLTGVASPR